MEVPRSGARVGEQREDLLPGGLGVVRMRCIRVSRSSPTHDRRRKKLEMKHRILTGLAIVGMAGVLGVSGPAMAENKPPEPPKPLCTFPPGGAIAPLVSTATPGGRDLIYTICSNSGRGESPDSPSGSEFKGRQVWGFDVDPGGSRGKNNGGDS